MLSSLPVHVGVGSLLLVVLSSATHAQSAAEAASACAEAVRLIDDADIEGALDEARWCVESLEQLRQENTLAIFPDDVDGFVGGDIDNQSAMGMTVFSRPYNRGADVIAVSLTTGNAGSGLAALAQMGMSLGAGFGRKLRIQKRTVLDMSDTQGEARFIVQLKSGGMLSIDSGDVGIPVVEAFVEAFPIIELDDALAR